MIVGIDLGGSAIKLAALDDGKVVFTRYIPNSSRPAEDEVNKALSQLEKAPDAVALTGVSLAVFAPEKLISSPRCLRVLEVDAIAQGTRYLTGSDDFLSVSIGTGTAFVLSKGGETVHIGGSAFGGGALHGLSRKILGCEPGENLDRLGKKGDLSRVDLLMSELPSCPPSLDPKLTAANLAKTTRETSDADWALGITNMVFQTIGSMAYLAARGFGVDTLVFTGGPTASDSARRIYSSFSRAYGLNFIVPEHSECATAIGAASLGAQTLRSESN